MDPKSQVTSRGFSRGNFRFSCFHVILITSSTICSAYIEFVERFIERRGSRPPLLLPSLHSSPKEESEMMFVPRSSCLSRRLPRPSTLHSIRCLATEAPNPPPRTYGGLRDQDRIFQNLYSRLPVTIQSAKKMGDWHRTKDILL